ncbi:MAG TPA: hemerythrin domain-containing protein [Holophagaceae bacterium]|nr:hemerythrin domain-containing protein [Holophagaceae bacterium]
MSSTRLCRDQHTELGRLMAELRAATDATPAVEARPLAPLLEAFAGKLRAHLAHEDRVLYPRLIAHEHEQVRLTARIYQAEMGRLGESFEAFLARWSAPDSQKADPAGFRRELAELLARLDLRIRREDRGLYALVERVESAVTNPDGGASQE